MQRKIMDVYRARKEILYIKEVLEGSYGRSVVWEKHKDGRKRQQILRGVIGNTFSKHFSIRVDQGWTTSFNYIDLLLEQVVLYDAETGKNILDGFGTVGVDDETESVSPAPAILG